MQALTSVPYSPGLKSAGREMSLGPYTRGIWEGIEISPIFSARRVKLCWGRVATRCIR